MSTLTILILLALAATIASLLMGVGSMGRGGQYDREHSNQFMSARVIFQSIALLLLVVALLVSL